MNRVEDKYICTERDLFLLESRVKMIMKPDSFSRDSSYRVTSVYFDDYFDSNLDDSTDGVDHRKKYRIRFYNGSTDVIKLEVKYKLYNRVFKKSKTITKEDVIKLISGEPISDDDVSIDNPVTLFNLAIRQDLLRPKVIVEYDRNAYIYHPGNVRITFDRNVRCSRDFDLFLVDKATFSLVNDLSSVLEIKYDEFLPGFLAQLMENGAMNQMSYSKYKLCREQLEERSHVF